MESCSTAWRLVLSKILAIPNKLGQLCLVTKISFTHAALFLSVLMLWTEVKMFSSELESHLKGEPCLSNGRYCILEKLKNLKKMSSLISKFIGNMMGCLIVAVVASHAVILDDYFDYDQEKAPMFTYLSNND